MLNKSALAHTPGREQGNVVPVAYLPDQLGAFGLPVAEILRRYITTDYKGVDSRRHNYHFYVTHEVAGNVPDLKDFKKAFKHCKWQTGCTGNSDSETLLRMFR